MDRHELLHRFGARWSAADRERVGDVLDTLGIVDLVAGSRGVVDGVTGWRAGDTHHVVTFAKGTVYVDIALAASVGAAPDATSGADHVIRLSTHTPAGGSRKPERRGDVCATCGMEMPLTGECDACA